MIAEMTCRMNALFARQRFSEATEIALQITAMSKDELRVTFERHGVDVKHLDHEAFGIYCGQMEPSYDVHVEGATSCVLAAAKEFGKKHIQEMVLITRRMLEGEAEPNQRMGLVITLNAHISLDEAVFIAEAVQSHGIAGATFAPNRNGEITIYHTKILNMTDEEFISSAMAITDKLRKLYPQLTSSIQSFIIHMPHLHYE